MSLTPEQARENQVKAAATRRQNNARAAQIVELTGPQTTYLVLQLADVREHIQRLSVMLKQTIKPGEVEKVARALKYLREDERSLCDRIAGGTGKPVGKSKPTIYAVPIEPSAVSRQ
jgi:hypothetical protein